MGKEKGNPKTREQLEAAKAEKRNRPKMDRKMLMTRIVVTLMLGSLLASGFVSAFTMNQAIAP